MPTPNQIFSGGFAEPVFAAQRIFRVLMDGMANPTQIASVGAGAEAPSPASPALAAIALTLLDHDTAVWLSPALRQSAFPQWLAFHTGAPITDDRMGADFALYALADGFPDLAGLPLGSDTYPDRSATLLIELENLVGGETFVARGPGIRDTAEFSPRGMPEAFAEAWALNHGLFPRGLDLILISGGEFLCLPRTTRLVKKEA
jgi:alpha-D-ribose 1-methylphosphonate 5-triphosphate synthase subunit PhnH